MYIFFRQYHFLYFINIYVVWKLTYSEAKQTCFGKEKEKKNKEVKELIYYYKCGLDKDKYKEEFKLVVNW